MKNTARGLECHHFVTPSELMSVTTEHRGLLTSPPPKKVTARNDVAPDRRVHHWQSLEQRDQTWTGQALKSSCQVKETQRTEEYMKLCSFLAQGRFYGSNSLDSLTDKL